MELFILKLFKDSRIIVSIFSRMYKIISDNYCPDEKSYFSTSSNQWVWRKYHHGIRKTVEFPITCPKKIKYLEDFDREMNATIHEYEKWGERVPDEPFLIESVYKKLRSNIKKKKSYFYGITITRNPSEQTVEEFIRYAEKFKKLKSFTSSNNYEYAYECYDKDKNLINEHVHIFLDADGYFSTKDFKKSFKYRIDVNRLTGEAIYKTSNYLKKDNGCIMTKEYYSQYMAEHFGSKN